MQKTIHFIAIGGSVMHNLAIALHQTGYQITGSDDEIYDPAKSRLQKYGLLPDQIGWFPDKITPQTDAVILGMHARKNNPELLKAKELGLKVYSYPEYIYEYSKHKQRIVIAGSHGKTTTTAMIMHVLNYYGKKFDYLLGAYLEGFETTVRLSEDAPTILIEGDEYTTSPLDLTPKFLHYQHHIALITGIAWDHINVYPSFDEYLKQFENLANSSIKGTTLVYCEEDNLAMTVSEMVADEDVTRIKYGTHPHKIKAGITYLKTEFGEIALQVFGEHNMQNLNGAKAICKKLGITDAMFYEAISSFMGASKRLERIAETNKMLIFKDFAHAPSKVRATVQSVKQQFPDRKLIACAELHTFSSLNKNFLTHYKNALQKADVPVVYFNPQTIEHKQLTPISEQDVKQAFVSPNLQVFTDSMAFREFVLAQVEPNTNVLLMSSGTFDGIDYQEFTNQLIAQK